MSTWAAYVRTSADTPAAPNPACFPRSLREAQLVVSSFPFKFSPQQNRVTTNMLTIPSNQSATLYTSVLWGAALLLISWVAKTFVRPARRFPPGPIPQLLVGNLRDMPQGGNEWDQYAKMSKKYGALLVPARSLFL